jgi:5-methyltetrahydropteroyltriglutamate--homocysteine methyltransferase
MRRSTDRILTSHVGALPGPEDLWAHQESDQGKLQAAVADVVGHQLEAGVDIVNEGELTKGGNWVMFVNDRLTGFEPRQTGSMGTLLVQSRDWAEFDQFYAAAMQHGVLFEDTGSAPSQARVTDWVCTGPVEYRGQAALEREIATLKGALGDKPASDAFLTSTAPASIEAGRVNEHYESQEAFLFALADALAVEYEAIAKAGLILQVDDAWLAALWDRIGVGMGLEGYRRFCQVRIEALNHALRNVPEEQVRYHLCWGSWHGPHAHDIPLPDIVDLLLSIRAQTYLIEAANVRHEHEASVWERTKLPEGKILAPGVVSHSTKLIEHPELVSSRIRRFAGLIGRENVIASTDCGLGLRCHPQIAWAKLKALSDGAALASRALWP